MTTTPEQHPAPDHPASHNHVPSGPVPPPVPDYGAQPTPAHLAQPVPAPGPDHVAEPIAETVSVTSESGTTAVFTSTDSTGASNPHTIYVTAPPAPKRSMTAPIVSAVIVGALAGGLVGGAVGYGTTSALIRAGSSTALGSDSPGVITVNNPDSITAVTAIAAKAAPSVVTISAVSREAAGSGSGIILSSDGLILTNTHVVTLDGTTSAPQLEVTTADGRLFPAEVVGLDPMTDLAVIKIGTGDKVGGVDNLVPIEWASSSELNVGDQAVVIGAPLGLANSVSDGIVSALNRGIRIASSAVPEETGSDEGAPEFDFDIPGLPQQSGNSGTISIPVIQTDAAVNPGNSGGGLVNDEGKLIGVIVAIAGTGGSETSGSIGVGFAIPSDLAQRISQELIENGSATHGLLGLTSTDAGSADGILGAVVREVYSDSPAAEAGLRTGDIITGVGGIPITSATDLTAQIRALAAGAETEISYSRGGSVSTVTVALGALQDA